MSAPVPTSFRRRSIKRLAALFVALLGCWLLSSYAVAYKLTRRAHRRDAEAIPEITWGKLDPLTLDTSDGEEIGAWHIGGRDDRAVVLLLHGNGGAKPACLEEAEHLAADGHPLLLLSLRAHGESSGELNDFGYSARHDVIAAVEWLEEQHPQRPIVVWGQSLGSAAAALAAGELGARVSGYVLECPYRDLHAAVWNRLNARLPPLANHAAYAGLLTVAPIVLGDVERISPCEAIGSVPQTVPVLIMAGGRDLRAPPSDAAAICEKLQGHVQLVVFENAQHLRLAEEDAERYFGAVEELIKRAED